MDNNPTDSNIKDQNPAAQSPGVQSSRKPARPRPTVEGINSSRPVIKEPSVKVSLTPQEQDLISETGSPKFVGGKTEQNNQKILPQSLINRIERKRTHYKAIFSIFIILLALVGGGYELYIKYVDTHIPRVQTTAPDLNSQPDAFLSSSTTPDNASGSPDSSLTASTTAANASSTMAGGTITTATTTPAPTPQPQLKINSTPTGYLNVRSQPSTGASVITQVHPGESYGYSQTQNGWYEITLTNGKTGWISGQYVTPQ